MKNRFDRGEESYTFYTATRIVVTNTIYRFGVGIGDTGLIEAVELVEKVVKIGLFFLITRSESRKGEYTSWTLGGVG